MPTGTCNYPSHHAGPSAGPPIALVVLIAAGAVIVAFWHVVVVALAVTGILAVAAGAVAMLLHNHRRYYDPGLERQAALDRAQPAGLPAPRPAAALEAAPVVHHHLHLHGISPDDAAALAARQHEQDTRPC